MTPILAHALAALDRMGVFTVLLYDLVFGLRLREELDKLLK